MKCVIACVQLTSTADTEANLHAIRGYVARARDQGAEWVLLPENCTLMTTSAGYRRQACGMKNNPSLEALGAIAREHDVWLLAGSLSIALHEGSDKQYNRSILFTNKGEITACYDKIHLCDINPPGDRPLRESEHCYHGERPVVAETPWGKVGLAICYDFRFPYLFRHLAKAGAIFLTLPAACTRPTGKAHWEILLRARAIENTCYLFAPAQTGEHGGGRKTWGHSLIIDPWGRVLADAGESPGIITAEIDTDIVEDVRSKLPSLTHDRHLAPGA